MHRGKSQEIIIFIMPNSNMTYGLFWTQISSNEICDCDLCVTQLFLFFCETVQIPANFVNHLELISQAFPKSPQFSPTFMDIEIIRFFALYNIFMDFVSGTTIF